MDERTDLKRDIEERRTEITRTVDEIENRVHPGRVASRQGYRARRTMSRWMDSIMGTGHDLREKAEDMAGSVSNAPDELVSRTRGNPLAAGAIAVGAGALVASLLPESRAERKLVSRIQPELERAGEELTEAGRHIAEDVKETAREGVDHLRESATEAGRELRDDSREAGERVARHES